MGKAERDPVGLIAKLPLGGRVLVAGPTGESPLLAAAVMAAGDAIGSDRLHRAITLRSVPLPADTAGGAIGRIVASAAAHGPASLSRFDTDIVTRHGTADLRGPGYDARAAALIGICRTPASRGAPARLGRVFKMLVRRKAHGIE